MVDMYTGMNPEYYVGFQSVFKFDPADKMENQHDHFNGSPGSRGSGSSSNTATQMPIMNQAGGAALNMMAEAAHQAVLPLLDRRLPIRRRQRKPNRKTIKTDIPAVTSTIKNRGRRPRDTDARARPTPAIKAPKGDDVARAQKRSEVKAPPNPPMQRARPPRNTPKKMWNEDGVEVGAWWGKLGGAALAMAEEEGDNTDYSPIQARKGRAPGPKNTKQVQVGGSCHPKRKKVGGPCVLCFATKSATWRRGAQGRPHVGLPLCNKCGVWEFRHPNSPPRVCMMMDEAALEAQLQAEMEAELQQQEGQQGDAQGDVQRVAQGGQQSATGRRRRAGAQGAARCVNDTEQPSLPLQHEVASTSAQAQAGKPMLKTTAASSAATAAAAAPASRMQRSEGNSVAARVPSAALNSQVQPCAQSGFATANMTGDDQGVQLRQIGGAKASRKRAAGEEDVQPAAKRWQGEAAMSVEGSGRLTSVWGGASAAKMSKDGRSSFEVEQVDIEMAEDGVAMHMKSVLESADTTQGMDEW